MTKTNSQISAERTAAAARLFNRRVVLKASAAAGAIAVTGPAYIKNALSSSGELNLLMWSDEFPNPVIPDFEAKTGIKVRGLRLGELPEKLTAAGVPSEVADDAKSMLEECEGGRYVPSPDPEATRELVKRAAALGKKLGA